MTPVPPKTLVSTVQVKFCRAQILGHPALILDLNLTLPHISPLELINGLKTPCAHSMCSLSTPVAMRAPRMNSIEYTTIQNLGFISSLTVNV